MGSNFSVDSFMPNTYLEIKNFLLKNLNNVLLSNREIIFLCIGTDRCTGDSLGPLVGHKLKPLMPKNKFYVYGTLESPVHSKNLVSILDKIHSSFSNPYIVAIDACLGKINNIGKIFIENKPLSPGLALNKNLPKVGDLSITGIVNISGNFEFLVLQNTRLYVVMNLAEVIYKGILHFTLAASKLNNKKTLYNI